MKLINYISDMWNKHGFEFLVVLALLFIIFYAIFKNSKGSGTWSDYFIYNKNQKPAAQTPFYRSLPRDSKGETISRQVLEKIFGKPFAKERPDFLRNPVTGGDFNLELDCFNREMKLALEYHGAQHYKYTPYFHKSKEAFYNQCYRDEMKRTKCRENGIKLIEVPYTVKEHNIEEFILAELRKFGYKV